jgi:hypothetical protein
MPAPAAVLAHVKPAARRLLQWCAAKLDKLELLQLRQCPLEHVGTRRQPGRTIDHVMLLHHLLVRTVFKISGSCQTHCVY